MTNYGFYVFNVLDNRSDYKTTNLLFEVCIGTELQKDKKVRFVPVTSVWELLK